MANANTDDVIMGAIANVIVGNPYNTRLANVGGKVYIQDEYSLSLGKFPALHIETDRQFHSIAGNNVYDGQVRFLIEYFDRWDQATVSIDAVRLQISNDLKVMMNNLQQNSSLTVGNTAHCTVIQQYELSPYKSELDKSMVPGLTLVKRQLKLWVNILPYDV